MNYFDKMIEEVRQSLEIKKWELVKDALRKSGFSDYADDFTQTRFPKVASVRRGGWDYFFADDGTNDGKFIIAISEYKIENNLNDPVKVTTSFQYHSDINRVEI